MDAACSFLARSRHDSDIPHPVNIRLGGNLSRPPIQKESLKIAASMWILLSAWLRQFKVGHAACPHSIERRVRRTCLAPSSVSHKVKGFAPPNASLGVDSQCAARSSLSNKSRANRAICNNRTTRSEATASSRLPSFSLRLTVDIDTFNALHKTWQLTLRAAAAIRIVAEGSPVRMIAMCSASLSFAKLSAVCQKLTFNWLAGMLLRESEI